MLQDEIEVQVIEQDGCPEIRVRMSAEPPPEGEPAQVQIRQGGDGIALRFRDESGFQAFQAAVAGA